MSSPPGTSPLANRRARSWPGRALLALGAIALALLGLELGLRLLGAAPAVNGKLVADVELGYRMPSGFEVSAFDDKGRPTLYRLNSLGFRGPELPAPGDAPAEGERILLLGDSFVTAWAVREEDWVGTLLQDELAARGVASHVYSAGSDDYGTAQELLLLRRYGPRVRPTAVVLLLYSGNDLINNTRALAGRSGVSPGDYFRPYLEPDEHGALVLEHALPWTAWLRHSALFTRAETLWLAHEDATALRASLVRADPVPDPRPALPPSLSYLDVQRPPLPGSAWARAWETTAALVRAVRDEARAQSARFCVVVIPSLLQVEDAALAAGTDLELARAQLPPADELVEWNLPEQEFERIFHTAAVEHAQILDPLRGEARVSRRSPYQRNGHLTDDGHRVLAHALAERLTDAGSTCFTPGAQSRPVGMPEFAPDGPLDVRFDARIQREWIDFGWLAWHKASDEARGGWAGDVGGALLLPTRRGGLALSGELSEACIFPLELRLTLSHRRHAIARLVLERPGPFVLSVTPRAELTAQQSEWVLVVLRLFAQEKPLSPDGRVRLRLTRVQSER